MADTINVAPREERITVKPAAYSITVVNTGPQGPAGPVNPSAGTPVISGVSVRGLSSTAIASGGNGTNIAMDPGTSGTGYLYDLGDDVEVVNNPTQQWMTYQYKINVAGLYHINGHVQHNGNAATAPLGSLIGTRVNGMCTRRHSLKCAPFETLNISYVAYLNVGDMVSLFGYSTGVSWGTNYVAVANGIDGYSPRMDVWRFGGAL